jgi:hypothetical protein
MDTTTLQMLSGAISGLISGGAGAAGAELLERYRKLSGRAGAGEGLPQSEEDIARAVNALAAAAERDRALAADLLQWLADARTSLPASVTVNNTVSGVVIGGSVVQTGIAPKK